MWLCIVNNARGSFYAPIETSIEKEVRAQMEAMYFGPLRLIHANFSSHALTSVRGDYKHEQWCLA